MKISRVILLFLFTMILSCKNPVGRSWIIPVGIDPSDLVYSPAHLDSFEARRKQALDSLKEGYIILRSNDQASFNRHEFRPNNYYYYLTGYEAPGSCLVLSNEEKQPFTLSLPSQSIRSAIYEGGLLSKEQVRSIYRPDRVLTSQELRMLLDSIIQSGAPVYMDLTDRMFYEDLKGKAGKKGAAELKNIATLLDQMRVIKEPMEVERMQKACNITAMALTNVMRKCAPEMYEFEMEAVIEGTFLQYGSAMPGFPSIVGSGPNSTTLHYEPNTRLMEEGDLLLMDVGAEYGYYTADITRTIPVNGKFSEEQNTIYQLVLDAQKAAIDQMVPGNGFLEGNQAAREVITEGLEQLGLITDLNAKWQSDFYCIHGFSHYLGMDVHDVGETGINRSSYRYNSSIPNPVESRTLEPGMVLTIEPGIYIRENGLDQIHEMFKSEVDSLEINTFVDRVKPNYEKYLHIGVRIEDDILITNEGNINLSRYAPREVVDIEQLMK